MRGRPSTAEIDGRRMTSRRPIPRRRARPLLPFSWQTWRRCADAKRLGYEASVLASVHGATRLGLDQELCLLLARAGLGEDAVAAVRLRGAGRDYGVILPTRRTWRHSQLRGLVHAVGVRAIAGGHRVLIVPPDDVQREPRLANAHHIFQRKLVPSCGDLEVVARHVEELGGEASLATCEGALASPLAEERIFGLVFAGHLEIDLSIVLTDRSVVRLRQPGWTFDWAALGWGLLRSDGGDPVASSEAAAASRRR